MLLLRINGDLINRGEDVMRVCFERVCCLFFLFSKRGEEKGSAYEIINCLLFDELC